MDETMLRYEAKDYDTAVRLHKEMHMTMIRNWVGQVGKEEFFDACDKYGILVWHGRGPVALKLGRLELHRNLPRLMRQQRNMV